MKQHPYLNRKALYHKTSASEPIIYYPFTVRLQNHRSGLCAGCGKPAVRVDSYYNFCLCSECEADEVGQAIADHVFEN